MAGFQSLIVGISGLQAQSNVISTISDNIANVSSFGYKKAAPIFQNLLGVDSINSYTAGGATTKIRYLNNAQGSIIGSLSPTDLAISGTGFFPIRQTAGGTGDVMFTRAGSFLPDAEGNFVNGAGNYLQGWLLDNEELPATLTDALVSSSVGSAALQTVNIAGLTLDPVQTTLVTVQARLTASEANYAGVPAYDATNTLANMSDGEVPSHYTRPFTAIDDAGNSHSLIIGFLKTGANAWAVEVYAADPTELGGGTAQIAYGNVTFNGDGSLASVSGSIANAIGITWTDPDPATNSFTFDWGTEGPIGTGTLEGLSQLDGAYVSTVDQNGFPAGSLRDVSVTGEGYFVGNYDNGLSRRLYKIPLAVFAEQNQLQKFTGNTYSATTLSGEASYAQAGAGSFGIVIPNALEGSNVDIASQLTDMVIAQRSYGFNSQIVSTSNEMLQTLTRLSG